MEKMKSKKQLIKITPAQVAKTAMLTAVSFLLYAFGKFNLPMLFPSFLEIHLSELPALLAGFSMGPLSGCAVIVLKCLLKFPMTSTAFVGEITDIFLGLCFVLPASVYYKYNKSRKGAAIGLILGVFAITIAAVFTNRFISIPFYLELFFKGNWNILLGIVRNLYPRVTVENFYAYYLGLAVVPFNLLRSLLVALITFLVYKRLSLALHWEFKKKQQIPNVGNNNFVEKFSNGFKFVSHSEEDTYTLAKEFASTLSGGEIILLEGDLGAGKTTFTKGLGAALLVKEEITSPTFTILNVYESGSLKLYHMDMYRIESEEELYETGIEEYVSKGGVTVIEWNKLKNLSGKVIKISIKPLDENTREFQFGS